MEKKLVLCDTNIFIEFYREKEEIIENLKRIGSNNIALSAITAGELIYGALNKRELKTIRNDIEHLRVLPVNENISQAFIKLMFDYSLSHNLDMPDALIAATAIEFDIQIYTLNKKHFKYIDGFQCRLNTS